MTPWYNTVVTQEISHVVYVRSAVLAHHRTLQMSTLLKQYLSLFFYTICPIEASSQCADIHDLCCVLFSVCVRGPAVLCHVRWSGQLWLVSGQWYAATVDCDRVRGRLQLGVQFHQRTVSQSSVFIWSDHIKEWCYNFITTTALVVKTILWWLHKTNGFSCLLGIKVGLLYEVPAL